MSSQKKIILFTIGNIDHPSSRIRGIQYIPYFEEAGYRVKWIPRIPSKPKNKFDKYFVFPILKRWYYVLQIITAIITKPDLFIIQKVFFPKWVMETIKLKKTKIIYDFDDAIYLNPKDLVNIDPILEGKTELMLKYSSDIIVSTSFLSNWCKEKGYNCEIITTPVDIYELPKKEDNIITIGWIGSSTNTVHLEELKMPLTNLAKKYNIQLLLVGANQSFNIDNVTVIHKKWELKKEAEYLAQMNIGIMPLLKNNYSKGKGGYKIFVYMGAGMPVVATPIGINKDIIVEGTTGYLANNESEWINYLSKLIVQEELRKTMGSTAKEIAINNYSRKVCSKKILDLIDNTLSK